MKALRRSPRKSATRKATPNPKTAADRKIKLEIIGQIRSMLMYDSSDSDYKLSRKEKTRKLDEFGSKLKPPLTGSQVYDKWYKLRGQYATNLRLFKSRPSGIESVKKKWDFFDSLRWLDDHLEAREKALSVPQAHLNETGESNAGL